MAESRWTRRGPRCWEWTIGQYRYEVRPDAETGTFKVLRVNRATGYPYDLKVSARWPVNARKAAEEDWTKRGCPL